MLTVNSCFIPPTHIPLLPEIFSFHSVQVCCVTFCPSTLLMCQGIMKTKTELAAETFSTLRSLYFSKLLIKLLGKERIRVIYNNSSFYGLMKDEYHLLECTF